MNGLETSVSKGRIVVAALALYGLLLQAFLMGLSPAISGPLASGLCSAASRDSNRPVDASRDHGQPCCVLGCGIGPAPLPAPCGELRSARAFATSVQWTPAPSLPVRPREHGSAGARGPPAV